MIRTTETCRRFTKIMSVLTILSFAVTIKKSYTN